MSKFIVDTNILLRIFVDNGDPHHQITADMVQRVMSGHIQFIVSNEVVIETIWVMKSYYKIDRKTIASTMLRFLESDGIHCSKDIVDAVQLFENTTMDIVDLLLSSTSNRTNTSVLTWDKDFKKLNCEWYTPAQIVQG